MKNSGFTLIELLIAIAIVGILYAISIPQFSDYKKKAYDLRIKSDIRNIAIAEEAYFIDFEEYFPCNNNTCNQLPGINSISKGVQLNVISNNDGYIITGSHPKATRTFKWDSQKSGFIESN